MGVSTVGRSMLGTAVPLFAVALDVAPLWVGVLVALPNALPVVLAVPAGRWVDGAGAGRWLAAGLIGTASAPLLLALAPGATALAAAQGIVGVFQLFSALAAQSYVAEASSDASLERDYATFATLLSAGRLVGPLLVGVVIDLAGFRAAFAAAGAAALAAVALAAGLGRGVEDGDRARPGDGARAASPDTDADADPDADPERTGPTDGGVDLRTGRAPAGDTSARFGAREAWRAVGVQLAVLASVAVFVGISVRQAFLPLVLEDLGYPATQIGALLSLGALASVAVRPAMPAIARRLGGPARTLVVAMATVAVGVGLLGVAGHLAAFALLTVAAGVGTGVGLPLSIVTVARHVAPGRRGTALGLRMSSNRAAQLVAPVLVGAVIGAAGFGAGFGVVGALLAAASLAAARRVGAFERSDPSA